MINRSCRWRICGANLRHGVQISFTDMRDSLLNHADLKPEVNRKFNLSSIIKRSDSDRVITRLHFCSMKHGAAKDMHACSAPGFKARARKSVSGP